MITKDIKTPIYIFKKLGLKDDLLNAISTMGTHSAIDNGQKLSNTDWYLNTETDRPYIDIIAPTINRCLDEISTTIKDDRLTTIHYWFQQYNQGDYHRWHYHGGCTYSSVYFVELPEQSSTTFMENGIEFQLDVEEGDYVVFPSILRHCSKENKTGKRKTTVSINIDLNL